MAIPSTPPLSQLPSRRVRRGPTRDEIEAENADPYARGWDDGSDLDDPPPCPYTGSMSAKLWRKGFSDRVDEYIARRRSTGGLSASLV